MDRATMQNFFLLGNAAGGQGEQLNDGQMPQQPQQQQLPGNDAQSQAAMAAGYPALMQQYLQQQQQQQQQVVMNTAAGMDPRFAGLGLMNMNFVAGGPQAGMMMPSTAGMIPSNTNFMDANRLLLQRLQGNQMMAASTPWIGDLSGESDPYAQNGILGPWSATSAGLLDKMASASTTDAKSKKVRKKPKDRPKRPLSAYNIFFKEERARILENIPDEDKDNSSSPSDGSKQARKRKKRPHGKIGFENLAKVIGQRWQELSPEDVKYYKDKAEADMKRYREEMEQYFLKRSSYGKKPDSLESEIGDAEHSEDDGDGEEELSRKKLKAEETEV